MNKLRNEIMAMKIQLNSSYGLGGVGRNLYDELVKKKTRFFKIQNRVIKIKRLFYER